MTCIHGLGIIVAYFFIYNIPLYNKMINLEILNDHDRDLDHIPLIVTLNFFMHSDLT